jgi:hypothetical protein
MVKRNDQSLYHEMLNEPGLYLKAS